MPKLICIYTDRQTDRKTDRHKYIYIYIQTYIQAYTGIYIHMPKLICTPATESR